MGPRSAEGRGRGLGAREDIRLCAVGEGDRSCSSGRRRGRGGGGEAGRGRRAAGEQMKGRGSPRERQDIRNRQAGRGHTRGHTWKGGAQTRLSSAVRGGHREHSDVGDTPSWDPRAGREREEECDCDGREGHPATRLRPPGLLGPAWALARKWAARADRA